ncbi:MAG TPA: UDPGP type 1 family protein, partial [Pirellulaceae bacterium]
MNIDELRRELQRFSQDHLLFGWSSLSENQREALVSQLREMDFELLAGLHAQSAGELDPLAWIPRSAPPPAIRLSSSPPVTKTDLAARACGEELLRRGQLAVLMVAGGQGTRLGLSLPKGLLPVGPISGRTLFQIHADRIRAVERAYATRLPWLIMTSEATHQPTLDYLARENFLGLDPSQFHVFCQGTMPAVDAVSGKVLLEAPGRIALSPDGHGGTLAALVRAGLLDRLTTEGVEHVFYFQVDNPLVDIADPTFLGRHVLAESEMTTQVVAKRDALERVGNVVAVDGQLRIVEYSDLPESLAEARNPDGSLRIWAGNIAVHAFAVPFLTRMSRDPDALPFHRAFKLVPCLDPAGRPHQPSSPNAIKFERFIFDILPYARHALVVEVDPAEAFAPVKNAAGAETDTLASAQAAMMAQHR